MAVMQLASGRSTRCLCHGMAQSQRYESSSLVSFHAMADLFCWCIADAMPRRFAEAKNRKVGLELCKGAKVKRRDDGGCAHTFVYVPADTSDQNHLVLDS